MKKKILLGLLCGVMVIGIATGCGNKENNNGDNNSANNPTVENNNNDSATKGEITVETVKKAKVTDASKFEYREVEGGIAITDYEGNDEIVVIPETIDGQTVVSIGDHALVNNQTMKGLRIADTIQIISDNAFENCEELQVFISGKSLKTIGEYACNNCKSLYSIELNEGLESLGDLSFGGCVNLEEIEIPSTVTQINTPFTANKDKTLKIISVSGGSAEEFVSIYGKNWNIVFQAK